MSNAPIKMKPELMSPAGHWPEMNAAIEAGADAVYFGLNQFSARAKVGFTLDELPEAMQLLHGRGVKGFVTFNTLVFDHEIEAACSAIEQISRAGVDAIIVQDIGIADLIHQQAPDLEIHGSTQMSVTSAEGVELARSLGCKRVVLGRELSLTDIRKIAQATDVELEVFVHGALCVSYSGQCFSSEAWGGRSANRGQCAQACRLPYDLIVDGHVRDLKAHRYLLSPGDLYALEQIPELIDIGISCVKIEGRYKSPEYVAATTRAYREAIDSSLENRAVDPDLASKTELEQVYSRGLGPHFMSGINHQVVVEGRAPRHRGRKAGEVTQVDYDSVTIRGEFNLAAGDGVVFDAAHRRDPSEREEGGFLYSVTELERGRFQLTFGRDEIDFSRIQAGDWIWRTHDPKMAKRLKPLTQAVRPVYTRPLDFEVIAKVDCPLEVVGRCDGALVANFQSTELLEAAKNKSLGPEQAREQLGRLGGTPFHLGELELQTNDVFVPVSLLNEARRNVVGQLIALRKRSEVVRLEIAPAKPKTQSTQCTHEPLPRRLHVLVRNAQQLDAALEQNPFSITLDYLELYGLRKSVEKIRAAEVVVRVASPRVLKPSEEKVIRFLLSLDSEILVRSGGLLYQLSQLAKGSLPPLTADFSLNAANQLSCEKLIELGVSRITPTHDLNAQQIAELAMSVQAAPIEVVAFHHLPVFHTEHCVFCRFLSDGTDSTNCGHPCETHRIALADTQGRQHPVMADVGCRNTVFGAEAQFRPESMDSWMTSGIHDFRIEFVHEDESQVAGVTAAFHRYLAAQIDATQLATEVRLHTPNGTTQGSLYVPKDFKNLVQLS